jgi:hypothetical protein
MERLFGCTILFFAVIGFCVCCWLCTGITAIMIAEPTPQASADEECQYVPEWCTDGHLDEAKVFGE